LDGTHVLDSVLQPFHKGYVEENTVGIMKRILFEKAPPPFAPFAWEFPDPDASSPALVAHFASQLELPVFDARELRLSAAVPNYAPGMNALAVGHVDAAILESARPLVEVTDILTRASALIDW
jgi:hypothetical protein